jgi:2-aminoadipate transaminase
MSVSDVNFRFSARALRTGAQPISYLMAQAVDNPDLISLAAGLVDYPTLPTEEAALLLVNILKGSGQTEPNSLALGKIAMQYGTTQGHAQLRQLLLEHLANLDDVTPQQLGATADDVVVTTGSQQLLFMLTDVMVDPGDIVITPWPSYFVYTGTLKTFGAEVRSVDIDDNGVIPEKLDALLGELKASGDLGRVKIVYIVDYHQNPTGITLSAERRPQILEIVKRYSIDHRILILEDAAYRELTYEGFPPPSIKKYDTTNEYVALAQTFSKPFAPGLKTGYGLMPSAVVEAVINQKGNHDFGSSNLCQHLLLMAMQSGVYQSQVQRLCDAYTVKRDAMLESLQEHLGDFCADQTHWTRPTGGLYVYLTLPPEMDTSRNGPLFTRCLAEGVIYVPGNYCYPDDPTRQIPSHHMRLSFGVPTIDQVREGIARLAKAIKAVAVAKQV